MSSEEKLYKNKEWLVNQIEVLGKTRAQIARECGVDWNTINYWSSEDRKTKQKQYGKEYVLNNKEKVSKNKKEYRLEHKSEIKEYQREYDKNYRKINKDLLVEKKKEYYDENKGRISKKSKNNRIERKIQVFNILGGCKCVICGEEKLEFLTIDHIDGTGYLDRKIGLTGEKLYRAIANNKYPQEKLSNLRVLCYDHNLGRNKSYLNLSLEQQTKDQKVQTKLWKEAYAFFGPCKTCGNSDLTYLTTSHIHNDGAKRRRNGEGSATDLLTQFRKQGWPESIKEDFCFECFNCNCSRK